MASNVSMPENIYQIIQDSIESALGKIGDLDVEKVCYSILQNVQDIEVLMGRVATLGHSLDNLYDELRQHKDTVARMQNQQANEYLPRAPLLVPKLILTIKVYPWYLLMPNCPRKTSKK